MSQFTINGNFSAKLCSSLIHILLKFRFRFGKAFGRLKAIVMEWIISDMIINNSLILLLQNKITIHNLALFCLYTTLSQICSYGILGLRSFKSLECKFDFFSFLYFVLHLLKLQGF